MHAFTTLLAAILSAEPVGLVPGLMVPFAEGASAIRVEQAATAGLGYLTESGVAWVRERKCASCHHTPEFLWTMHSARSRGWAIDEAALAEVRTASFHADDRAKLFPQAGQAVPETVSLGAVYLGLAELASAPADAEVRAMMSRIAAEIVSKQQADGSWKLPSEQPPLSDPHEMTTLQCVIALTSPWLADDAAREAIQTGRDRGLQFLAANPATDGLQFDVYRILLQRQLSKPADEDRPLVERIISRQRADGGWGQINELPSDALATGQALYALGLAGVDLSSAAIDRGRTYLVNTQTADGSWIMHSRPRANQPSGSKNLKPISYAGTAWATMGLLNAMNARPIKTAAVQ